MKSKLIRYQFEGDSAARLASPGDLTPAELQAAVPFTVDEATTPNGLRELADYLDQRAESINAHEFVGVHRLLATLLHSRLGAQAGPLMYEIAEYGGLHGMNGVCGEDSAFEALRVAEPWKDWRLA